ncbi:MAG: beta-ketoacyl-ACP synthase III [Candidatus Altiarchaeota archaeon]
MKKELRAAGITATGSYAPEKIVTNSDIVERGVDTSDEWIYTKLGIKERRFVTDEETSDLTVNAIKNLLKETELAPADLDMIIVATGTPDMMSPSTACIVQDKLKAKNAAAFDINNACTGFNYAIEVGAKFVADGTYDNVVVVGAEVNSTLLNWDDRTTCVYFADAAGAVLLNPVGNGYGMLGSYLGADGSKRDVLYVAREGNDYFKYRIHMDGKAVWDFAVNIFPTAVRKAVEQCDLTIEDIDFLISHQANINIIEHCMKELGLSMDQTYTTIRDYGNTVAASIPLSLDYAVRKGKIKRGDIVVFVGFGAGLTWGANVVRWV